MCMFSQPVESVDSTKIFCRTTSKQTQFLVYQMKYDSPHSNAMILPIPVQLPTGEDRVRFIDLSHYEGFFGDLAKGFPVEVPWNLPSKSARVNAMPSGSLEVVKVGNYVASFVPSLQDFSRLDPTFALPDAIWKKLPEYADFGFVVFQLGEGKLKPHPMAFEFESRQKDVFFPTLHIHDGEIHPMDDFDHELYVQHAGFDSLAGAYQNFDVTDRYTNLIRSKYFARQFIKTEDARGIVAADLLVHRRLLNGTLENRDSYFAVSGDPLVPKTNLRWLRTMTPLILLAGALTWLIRRRNLQRALSAEKTA